MSAWGTSGMAAALPDATAEQTTVEQTPDDPIVEKKNPQEYGWVATTKYDYETYNSSTKETAQAQASTEHAEAQEGIISGDWANKGALYEWKDEYGDVGPRFEDLEKQLFASEFHVRTGIKFDALREISVTQEGNIRINPVQSFDQAGLHPVMRNNVSLAGYDIPTPIQQYVLPAIFKGHDVVACAQTGSGKTAAFLIPILSKLMGKAKKLAAYRGNPALMQEGERYRAEPLVLIVCPNRELATQIFDEARRFCYRTMLRPCVVYGGCPLREQVPLLEKGCDVLIATPGRLIDFMSRPALLTLKRLKYMVIDEADEMLQSDWETELNQIMSGGDQEEGNITYMMFSATFPKTARDLAKQHLAHDHVRIRVGRAGSTHANIKQDVVFVEPHAKRQALFDLLMTAPPARTIIFVNSKRSADEIDDYLFNSKIPCTSIHSDRTQREREDSIRAFRNGKAPVLIATGVSARGLDIHNVMHVINYDLPSPQYGGIEEYTHRIGRTGRIGNLGLATSFYNERDSDIAETLVKTLLETRQVIPDFLEQFIPEGFTAEGHGDVQQLKFEADSDYGEGEGENGEVPAEDGQADDGGGWGAAPAAPVQEAVAPWGQQLEVQAPAAPTAPGLGTQERAIVPTQPVTANNSGLGSAPPAQTPPSVAGFGNALAQPPHQSNAGSSWGQPSQVPQAFQVQPAPQGYQPIYQGHPAQQNFQGTPVPQGFYGPLTAQGPPPAMWSAAPAAAAPQPAQQAPPTTWGAASAASVPQPAQQALPATWGAGPAASVPQPAQQASPATWGAAPSSTVNAPQPPPQTQPANNGWGATNGSSWGAPSSTPANSGWGAPVSSGGVAW